MRGRAVLGFLSFQSIQIIVDEDRHFSRQNGIFLRTSVWRIRRIVKLMLVFCAKETPDIKVVVAFVTFGIIVQFLFLLAGAR